MRKRKQKKRQGFKLQREKKRVAVLTPCADLVHTEYAMSLLGMFQATNMEQPSVLESVHMKALGTSILPKGRQDLADSALAAGCTHVLWIDSDMKFPADTLLRLLRYDEPIVGINSMARRPPYMTHATYEDGTCVPTVKDSSGLEKVGRCGFGLLWVDVRVFAEMERPFFNFHFDTERGQWEGEDYYFLAKAKALGFDVHIDHDLTKDVLHIGTFGYHPLLADYFKGET
jgi:hypothetical protein